MKKKELPPPIHSDDYQKFAKKKKAKLSSIPTDASLYQKFVYDKENIPEDARISTKTYGTSKAFNEMEAHRTEEMIAKAKALQNPPEKQNSVVKQKKALSLVEQIKNPEKHGDKDSQLGFRKIKGKNQFYLKVGGHEVPFDVDKYGGEGILDDATSQRYQEPKEKVIREYETNLKNNSKAPTKAEEQTAAKAAESAIAD
jgi:hypothetical protein